MYGLVPDLVPGLFPGLVSGLAINSPRSLVCGHTLGYSCRLPHTESSMQCFEYCFAGLSQPNTTAIQQALIPCNAREYAPAKVGPGLPSSGGRGLQVEGWLPELVPDLVSGLVHGLVPGLGPGLALFLGDRTFVSRLLRVSYPPVQTGWVFPMPDTRTQAHACGVFMYAWAFSYKLVSPAHFLGASSPLVTRPQWQGRLWQWRPQLQRDGHRSNVGISILCPPMAGSNQRRIYKHPFRSGRI